MPAGVRSTDLPPQTLIDAFLGNREGATAQVSFAAVQAQMEAAMGVDQVKKRTPMVALEEFGSIVPGQDHSAVLNAAFASGESILMPQIPLLAANLTQSANQQHIVSSGFTTITKIGNGPLFSGAGDDLVLSGVMFRGDEDAALTGGFTGDNVMLTGQRPQFVRCASMWTPGRAIKATGGKVLITDPIGPIATADTSGDGYDIELGQSGVATLYHRIVNWDAGSFNGGILLIDTGSHYLAGGLFGKLTIQAGTQPGGVNGGMTMGCRIGRDILVEQSNAVFVANQPESSECDVTFAAGTSGCRWDVSNLSPKSITNDGNANNLIMRETSTGGTNKIAYGDGDGVVQSVDPTAGDMIFPGSIGLENGKSFRIKDGGGTPQSAVTLSASDDFTFGADTGANWSMINCGSAGGYMAVSGTSEYQWADGYFRPIGDGADNLGGPSNRWANIYATNGTINVSDARAKVDINLLDAAEQATSRACKGLIRTFRYKDAVEQKGDAARIHVGVIAQEVIAAFEANGLDPFRYGIVCYDEWEAQEAVVRDDKVIEPAREAGNRYGIRYEELLAFIIAAL
ncbi:tail fiber domain-containing protein [Tropicibacter sp. Alg240-R139]|uniref:tail fiber domain-containing protein n=1 Tax=Tropicibacter sp. Alg240-R139 TaxID=2305991 RepID=UPI0013E0405E|nr:tail fiber domain-containing protein [Tropicibacter sp. Alg240-R139]